MLIASRLLISQPRVVHVNHNLELVIVLRALSSRPKFIHVIHNPHMFIASRALNSGPRVIHVNHNLELCRPSILSLDTGIYPSGVTSTHRSHMAPLRPLLGLVGVRASCGFVCGPLWCICGSFGRSPWPFS